MDAQRTVSGGEKMLRENDQIRLSLSPYSGLYDIIVREDPCCEKSRKT
jgi:hypothetical protein